MQHEILARIEPVVSGIVTAAGMELVHAEVRREGGGLMVRLYIDKDGGVTLDDCARVSRLVSAHLDADDPIPDRYTLEVSSPGFDRPLSRERDFERFTGHLIRLSIAAPMDGRRNFHGRLQGLDGGTVHLLLEDGTEVAIPRDLITKARLADNDAPGTAPGARGRHA